MSGTRYSFHRGQPSSLMYVLLRRHHLAVAQNEASNEYSGRQLADRFGVNRTTYSHLVRAVAKYSGPLAEGEATGDWSALENALFAKFGDFRRLPFYARASALVEDRTTPVTSAAKSARTKSRAVSQLPPTDADLRRKLDQWLRLGQVADQYLSPQGKAALLRLAD